MAKSGSKREQLLFPIAVVAVGALSALAGLGGGEYALVWPPAGLLVAAVVLRGMSAWPGAWIGSFLLFLGLEAENSFTPAAFGGAAVAATVATLHAVIAASLSRRIFGRGAPAFHTGSDFLAFGALTGPVAALVHPAAAWALGDSFQPTFLVQTWVAHSLGTWVVAPLCFCAFAEPRSLWAPRRMAVGVAVPALLMVVGVSVALLRAREASLDEHELDRLGSTIHDRIEARAQSILSVTELLAAAVTTENEPRRATFAELAKGVLEGHPEVRALEWSPRVPHDALAQVKAKAEAEGLSGFDIFEKDPKGMRGPVARREAYFPVYFTEPLAGNERAVGYDLGSEPIRASALQAAISGARPHLTAPIVLVQETGSSSGVLLFVPARGGVVLAVLRLDDLVHHALSATSTAGLTVSVRDSEGGLLYGSEPEAGALQPPFSSRATDFGGRTWTVAVQPSPTFFTKPGTRIANWALLVGLLASVMQVAYLMLSTDRNSQIGALVAARTNALRTRESLLRTVIDSELQCVAFVSATGELTRLNRAALALFQATTEADLAGLRLADFLMEESRVEAEEMLAGTLRGESKTLAAEFRGLQGKRSWVDLRAEPIRDGEGLVTSVLCLGRDMTQQHQSDIQLVLAAGVFSSAQEGIAVLDPTGRIIDVNPTYCEITGFERDELIGSRRRFHRSSRHRNDFYTAMDESVVNTGRWRGEVWNLKQSGEPYAERLTISVLRDERGAVAHHVHLLTDVTESRRQQDVLEWMAHYDPLTHLPNRTLLGQRFNEAATATARTNGSIAICFLDLDGFKPVNDQYGHDLGDRLLTAVAGRFGSFMRTSDTVSRHGGDEFILLLSELESKESATQIVTRLHVALGRPYWIDGHEIRVTASSGLALWPADADDLDGLVRLADQAHYRAKHAGKNCFRWSETDGEPSDSEAAKRRSALEFALRNGQLCLYAQPKVDMVQGTVVGAEALIRWNHPERGVLPPGDFLGESVGTDLELEIGNWVFDEAYRILEGWAAAGLSIPLAVNVSARQVLSPGFVAGLEARQAAHPQLPKSRLEMELLEANGLGDVKTLHEILGHCQAYLRIPVALDDFGTGDNSLLHLRTFTPNFVKIERAFVSELNQGTDDRMLIAWLVKLANVFGCTLIAEGVETIDLGLALIDLGCNVGQGYGIGRPMPPHEFVAWTAAYRAPREWTAPAGKAPRPTVPDLTEAN